MPFMFIKKDNQIRGKVIQLEMDVMPREQLPSLAYSYD